MEHLHVPSIPEPATQAVVRKQLWLWHRADRDNLREVGLNLVHCFRRFIPWSLELCFLVCSKADHHSGRSVQGNNFMVDRKQREKEYRKRPVQSLDSRDVSLGIYPIQLGPTPYLSPAPNNAIIFSLRDSLFIELELLKV